jgi:proteic killer suppression protein
MIACARRSPAQIAIRRDAALTEARRTTHCNAPMIKIFRHKGLERLFREGSKAGIQAAHANRLRLQLAALDQAVGPQDISAPACKLHQRKGDLNAHWAITVNGNWRMVFMFEGRDAILVDYLDFH